MTAKLILGTEDMIAEERENLKLDDGEAPNALCLSGGGVRSAAFCLGVIQGLAQHGLLGRFHYLSTVSGGGYIGGWLTRVIGSRLDEPGSPPTVSVDEVGRLIAIPMKGQEAKPVQGLRRFTNFLTPNPGLLSLDLWAGAMLWLRNTLINWLLFTPVFVVLVALPILYFAFASALLAQGNHPVIDGMLAILGILCLGIACHQSIVGLPSHSGPDKASATAPSPFGLTGSALSWRVVAPMVLWCLLVPVSVTSSIKDVRQSQAVRAVFVDDAPCTAVPRPAAPPISACATAVPACPVAATVSCGADPAIDPSSPIEGRFTVVPFLSLIGCLVAYGLAYLQIRRMYRRSTHLKDHLRPFWKSTWAWVLSSVVSACLLWYGIWLARSLDAFWLALAGPVWVGFAEVLRTTLYVAFRKEGLRADLDREWLARLNAAKLMVVLAGGVVGTIVVVGSLLSADLSGKALSWLTAGGLTSGSIAALLGKSAQTAFAQRSTADTKADKKSRIPHNLLLSLAIVLFGCTLLVVIGRAVAIGGGVIAGALWGKDAETPFWTIAIAVFGIGVGAGCLAWWLGGRINVNRFSMHAVYRNRLVRGFLGSARPAASSRPDRFTSFDPADNVRMVDTFDKRTSPALLPVINVALNRTSGKDTARAERKAESFTITPFRCGAATLCGPNDNRDDKSSWTGAYVKTEAYAGDERQTGREDCKKGISLGTAMTISGAAASPNMGYHSSPLVAFVMTLFNVRLGAWLPNPGVDLTGEALEAALKHPGPRNSLVTLMEELAGRSDRDGDYLYLSDGGHIDNLGLYEMLRRRCQLIVIADASQDEKYKYEDLGRVKQHVLIDLGVTIDFKPAITVNDKVLADLGANGTIGYPDGTTGKILYLKPWMSEEVPLELAAFRARKGSFPHESTGNQFFTESDFESYRRLGEFITDRLVGKALAAAAKLPNPPSGPLDRVFAGLG